MKKIAYICIFFLILINVKTVHGASIISFDVEIIPWEEVNHLLPRYSKFTVIDVETGKQFRVQRRAGSQHADVQPLSAKDTKIMKNIYGGKWSWKRRAIIVKNKDQWIAASMHGMPHGAGALKNNFPGHFCIHFLGSTTHRTKTMDLGHKLMILKAGGELETYLGKASPYEVVEAFITGLKQHDGKIVSLTSLQKKNLESILNKIENIKITRMPLLPAEDLIDQISFDVPIEIDWNGKEIGRQTFNGEIHLVRFSPYEGWKIDFVSFSKDFF